MKKEHLNLLKEKHKLVYWQFVMGILLSWLLIIVLFPYSYVPVMLILLMPIEVAFVIALRSGNVAKAMFIPIVIPTILFSPLLLAALVFHGIIWVVLPFGVLTLLSGTGAFIGKMIYNKKSSSLQYDSFSKKLIISIVLILYTLLFVVDCFI